MCKDYFYLKSINLALLACCLLIMTDFVNAQTRFADSVSENFTPTRKINFSCMASVGLTSDGVATNNPSYCPQVNGSPTYAITYNYNSPNRDEFYESIQIWANGGNIYSDDELRGFDIVINYLDSSGSPAMLSATSVSIGDTVNANDPKTVSFTSLGGPAAISGISTITISNLQSSNAGGAGAATFRELHVVDATPQIRVTKSSAVYTGNDPDGDGTGDVDVGDIIVYSYVVTNTGLSTVFNTTVTEPGGASFSGTGALPSPSYLSGGNDYDSGAGTVTDLRAGETVSFDAAYSITAADLAAMSVTNQATASATDFHGANASDLSGDTNSDNNPTVTTYDSPTFVSIGSVELVSLLLDQALEELGIHQMSTEQLLALTSEADSSDANIVDYDQALSKVVDYLDPDEDGEVLVFKWDTTEEQGTIGFHVERHHESNDWVRLNKRLLPALIPAPYGAQYLQADPSAQTGKSYQFRLIEQEVTGRTNRYGPFEVGVF